MSLAMMAMARKRPASAEVPSDRPDILLRLAAFPKRERTTNGARASMDHELLRKGPT
jgi:hypothetical protein